MLMTSEGTMIRMAVCEIPVYKRSAGGVIVMRTSGEAKVASFTVIANEEEIEGETANEVSSEAPAVTE
jgi:DNA gyrase/topoisomerase IV subunit A